ncbi:MAG: TatD family hydrolase [Methylococcales bacterium]|nr:TatD family hydrolase [Methylococcales bacterium]
MFIDSHCHLDRIDLTPYQNDFAVFMQAAKQQHIQKMLCVAIDLESYPAMRALVKDYPQIFLSVGVHPNVENKQPLTESQLLKWAENDQVIAIGETGLDYFRSEGDLDWQHQRFKTHIRVAKALKKPLIIHTREAGHDALDVLEQEGAAEVGGVIHCFTEDWEFAKKALALNFYISFSGIVTFKNALAIQEAAKQIPNDKFLIETDSPYLAPVPFRGKPNYPLYVPYVAKQLALLRDVDIDTIATQSTANFNRLFGTHDS